MIIGVPVFACIYDILGKLMRYCLKKRGEDEAITHYEKEFLTSDGEKTEKSHELIIRKVKKMFNRDGQVVSEEEVFYDTARIDEADEVHYGASVSDGAVVVTEEEKPESTEINAEKIKKRKGSTKK